MSNSQRYLVVGFAGLVGLWLGLPLTVTIRVSRVSAMVSVGLAEFVTAVYRFARFFDSVMCMLHSWSD